MASSRVQDDKIYLDHRVRWAKNLRSQLSNLTRAFETLALNYPDTAGTQSIGDLCRLSHNLSGAAATFGFHDLAQCAEDLEQWSSSQSAEGKSNGTTADDSLEVARTMLVRLTDEAEAVLAETWDEPMDNARHANPWKAQSGTSVVETVVYVGDNETVVDILQDNNPHLIFRRVRLSSEQDVVERLAQLNHSAIVLDLRSLDAALASVADAAGFVARMSNVSDPSRPVIALSDQGDLEDRLKAVRIGAQGFIEHARAGVDLAQVLREAWAVDGEYAYKLVLIDDDPAITEFFGEIFSEAGFDMSVISNPADTLDTLKTVQPDVVLMDVNMPGCSGIELALLISQHRDFNHIPLLLLSSGDPRDNDVAAGHAAFQEWIDKAAPAHVIVDAVVAHADRGKKAKVFRDRMARAEATLDAVEETAADGILTVDQIGHIKSWSWGAERIFGYKSSEIVGKDFSKLVYDQCLDAAGRALQRAFEGEVENDGLLSLSISGVGKQGLHIPIKFSVSRPVDSPGEVPLAVICVSDDQINGDVEQHQEGGRIGDLIEEATREIKTQSAELRSALEAERKENRRLRRYVSMAAHEFRTPLAIIDGSAHRLLKSVETLSPDIVTKRATKITEAVKRMMQVIENTLTSARLDAGKEELKLQPCDVSAMLQKICEDQQELSPFHSISLHLDNLPELILADAGKLEHIFSNLLSNAVKYSPQDPEIEVTAGDKGGRLVISVKDHGVGIDADDVGHVFDCFFRAGTSAGISGTGLGLHLVKQLVDLHGGNITVDSVKGQGTTFTVQLPVFAAERPASLAEYAHARKSTRGFPRAGHDNGQIDGAKRSKSAAELQTRSA